MTGRLLRVLLFIGLSPLLHSSLLGQHFIVDTLRDVSPYEPHIEYVFPLIRCCDGNNYVGDSINSDLARNVLEISVSERRKSIFENVWGTEERPQYGLHTSSFNVLRNDHNMFSVAISAEWCSAYCEYFDMYFNYDSRTGRPVHLASLLNDEGLRLLLDSLAIAKRRMIEEFLRQTNDSLEEVSLSAEDEEYYNEVLSLFTGCLEDMVPYQIDHADYIDFVVAGRTLTVIADRCSRHFDRSLDTLGEFFITFDLAKWKPYLSEFGSRLLNH